MEAVTGHASYARRLGALSAGWWGSLTSAEAALRHAAMGPDARAAHDRLLRDERVAAAALLLDLAHDWGLEPLLVGALASGRGDTGLLGLPGGIRACVFDLDGVLTQSTALHRAAWADTLDAFLLDRAHRHGRPFVPFDRRRDYETYLAARPRLDGIRAFVASRGLGVPEGEPGDLPGSDTVHGIANAKSERLRVHLVREGVASYEGAHTYLDAARILGVARAVVSPSLSTGPILESAGIAGLIDVRVDGQAMIEGGLRSKPEPDTLLAACRALEVEPAEAAAFETTPRGIAAARAAGFRVVVAVARPEGPAAVRASDADSVVGDLAELLRRGAA